MVVVAAAVAAVVAAAVAVAVKDVVVAVTVVVAALTVEVMTSTDNGDILCHRLAASTTTSPAHRYCG